MQNSRNSETLALLQSPPIPVRFAGFESDTYRLQQAGWQLSIEKAENFTSYDYRYRLALKHEPAKLFAISNMLVVNRQPLYETLYGSNSMALMNYFRETGFDIVHAASNISFQIVENHMPNFQAIDAEPQWDRISKNVNLEDLAIFRPLSAESEIVVHPDSVPELLQKIREAQAPKQAEIRESKRKEVLRASLSGVELTDEMQGYNPAKDIMAQVIAIGS